MNRQLAAVLTIRYRMDVVHVRNVHERVLPAPPERVRPWLDRVWSGRSDDVFPHDVFVTWRDAHEAGGFPVATRFGHATLRFRLRRWDGERWEADVLSRSFRGWHEMTLERDGSGTRVRHVLEGILKGQMLWRWPAAIRPLHDWAVEALLDRLDLAVKTGQAPAVTTRGMSAHTRLAYVALDRLARGGLSGVRAGAPGNWRATTEEMRAAYPCDALIVPPDERLYRAVTIAAPQERVFRWLCQLRVSPYSYDWIDNGGRRSPPELTPGAEALAVGQSVMSIFELASFEPGRSITLRIVDPRARRAFGEVACTYAVMPGLVPDESRLVVKLLVRYPRSLAGRAMASALPWGDWIMMRKQLLTLKALAERDAHQARRSAER